jgi:AcrR family transcriptional regulator
MSDPSLSIESDREPAPGDGRAARRDRNRNAVLDAVVELFSEGNLDPGPEEVAIRAGLSARSVYRYFEDRDALVRAAIDRHLEKMLPLYLMHAIGEGDFDERLERFADARLRLYEAIAPTARAARRRAAVSPIFHNQVELTRRALREQVERHFAPELRSIAARERRAVTAAADTLCQFESLDHYRVHRGFSSRETRSCLVEALRRLLGS